MKKEIYTDEIPEGYKLHCPDVIYVGTGEESDESMQEECSVSN